MDIKAFEDASQEYYETFRSHFPTEETNAMSTDEMTQAMRRCIEEGKPFVSEFQKMCEQLPEGSVLPLT